MTLRIAGLGSFAPGFELRPYRPPRRVGQQAFHGLVAGGALSACRTGLRESPVANRVETSVAKCYTLMRA
jgi:hypothetical protein